MSPVTALLLGIAVDAAGPSWVIAIIAAALAAVAAMSWASMRVSPAGFRQPLDRQARPILGAPPRLGRDLNSSQSCRFA